MSVIFAWGKQILLVSLITELAMHLIPKENYRVIVRIIGGMVLTLTCVMPIITWVKNPRQWDLWKMDVIWHRMELEMPFFEDKTEQDLEIILKNILEKSENFQQNDAGGDVY